MAKCCFHCLRIIVIIFNLLFVLVGCAILGIAIFLYVDSTFKGIKENLPESKFMVDIILFTAIGIGGITIIVSTFGCCGAYHESECLLGTYFFCLFVIVAAEIAGGVVLYLKFDQPKVKEALNKSIKSSIDLYMSDSSDAGPPEHLKQMQRALSCCGAEGYTDYLGSSLSSTNPLSLSKLPKLTKACAPGSDKALGFDFFTSFQGCTERILKIVSDYRLYVLVICLVIAVIEILSMIIAMSLCCTVRRMESGYIGVST